MDLDFDACYRAIATRDARFDGRFFTGVRTTGIYCRPICPDAAARERQLLSDRRRGAGRRLSPVSALPARDLAGARCLARHLEHRVARPDAHRGWSARRGRGGYDCRPPGHGRTPAAPPLHQHLGASPLAVAQTRRVLLARQLIDDTDLPMTEVALAAGFGSLRRFNDSFHRLYGRPPSVLRRRRGTAAVAAPSSALKLNLPYRPPYDWAAMLGFLAARAIPGVERIADDRYTRTIELEGAFGTIAVAPSRRGTSLVATLRFPQVTELPEILARLRRIFDLAADPLAIAAHLAEDPVMAPLVAARPGLRVPGAWDGFELAVRAILGQQITVATATRLAEKLVAAYGTPLAPELVSPGLSHAFPRPERLARRSRDARHARRARPRHIGIGGGSRRRSATVHHRRSLESGIERLIALPGIGAWTACYIAMRAVREPDAFPAADIDLMRALADVNGTRPNAAELAARADAWRPWRAYAALHLWMANRRAQPAPAPDMEIRDASHNRASEQPDRHASSRL